MKSRQVLTDTDAAFAGRKRRGRWWGGIALAVAAAAVIFVAAGGLGRDSGSRPETAVPQLEMTDFDGETFTLAEYRGTPVVVNFWASWCPSCVAEMPDFEKVHQRVKGSIAFVGINHSDSREAAEALAKETGVTYRLAYDPRAEVFAAFGGAGMPTTAFVDASGTVVDVVIGQLTVDLLEDYMRSSFGDAR